MKGLAALGAAGFIAAVGALWFLTNPAVVTVIASPMQPNSALPTFKQVQENVEHEAPKQPASRQPDQDQSDPAGLLALPKPNSRRAVAASGPILSMAQPCFGQTGMKCGQNVADLA